MKKQFAEVFTGVAIAGLIGITGCSTSQPQTKSFMSGPAGQLPGSGADARGLKSSRSTGDNLKPGERQSSLDALRRGDSPTTPRDSAMKEVYFAFDQYDLDPEDRATLRANADWLKKNPAARIEIEGHSDERGTNEYNLALGAKRAQAAKDYLVSLGIPASRISTISYGEEIPVCRSQGEACWQKNRRDRFVTVGGRPTS